MRRFSVATGVLGLVCLIPKLALASPACGGPCATNDFPCLQRRVACLVKGGAPKEALKEAKKGRAKRPHDSRRTRLVARAYLATKNTFWAQRVLQEAISRNAGDCLSRSWLAWIQLREGDLDLAQETLGEGPCPTRLADRGRWALLQAMMARAQKDTPRFAQRVDQATKAGALYPEDRPLWRDLYRATHPGAVMPLRLRAEIGLGYTSNINAGLPLTSTEDGASRPEISAALGIADLRAQLVLPWWKIAPSLELGLRSQYLDDFSTDRQTLDTRDASYVHLEARPGLQIHGGWGRLFVGYHADLFMLRGGDRYDKEGLLFFEGHRLEGDFERGSLTLFAGTGRRIFRQTSRSRWELDGGLGYGLAPLPGRLTVLLALSLRFYFADGDAFNATGATLLSAARLFLGKGFYARASLSLGLDLYSDAPRADPQAGKTGGTDLQLKARLGLWSPAWRGFRMGLRYQFSLRETELQVSFPYQDHRVLLGLRVSFSADPWAPTTVSTPGHVAFPRRRHVTQDGVEGERLRELLRQDEAAQRGSSCVN